MIEQWCYSEVMTGQRLTSRVKVVTDGRTITAPDIYKCYNQYQKSDESWIQNCKTVWISYISCV
jgi:hypothetical protein